MNDPMNALRSWMAFYDQNFGPVFANTQPSMAALNGGGGYDSALKSNANRNAKMQFLQEMMSQPQSGDLQSDLPDYFAKVPSSTAPPMAPQAGYNRLAALMGRRY